MAEGSGRGDSTRGDPRRGSQGGGRQRGRGGRGGSGRRQGGRDARGNSAATPRRDAADRPDRSRETAPGRGQPRRAEPEIPEDITGQELDPDVRRELSTLPRPAATRVAKHLVAAGRLLDEDPEAALAHAVAARQSGARLGLVREACGLAAYAAGHYEQALAELRAAKRLTGSVDYLPVMADCERGLGRPERALELAASAEAGRLDQAGRMELRIVAAGARRDLGQPEAALQILDVPELYTRELASWTPRIRYAYADTLEELGRRADAAEWFGRAALADVDGETDATDRQAALEHDEAHGRGEA